MKEAGMRTFMTALMAQTRRALSAVSLRRRAVAKTMRRAAARLRVIGTGELAALAVAVVVLVVGPVTVFAYGRWMDRRVVVVHATQWQYAPKVLHATAGVPFRIRLVSEDVVHGFKILGLDSVQVTELIPGKSMELTVTPPKPGTYIYMCTTYCGLKHATMYGQLIVAPR
jgi:heme/copper-type cytochrome/quinol oxidase subunit 2